jgi:hypothetical protein
MDLTTARSCNREGIEGMDCLGGKFTQLQAFTAVYGVEGQGDQQANYIRSGTRGKRMKRMKKVSESNCSVSFCRG